MIVVIVVALVCVGLYVGDRYAHRRAEGRVAAALQPPLGTPARPQVDIEGFPFLTQIAAGSVGKMQIVADQLGETTNAPVILAHADLVMTDVVTNDWFKTMKITHTEGTGLIDYTKLFLPDQRTAEVWQRGPGRDRGQDHRRRPRGRGCDHRSTAAER
jgi:hypothetical protein